MTAPAATAATTVVSDSMTRTVSAGLGVAPTGGAYVVDEPDAFSVDGSTARVKLGKGLDRVGRLATKGADVESGVTFSLASIPTTGSGVYLALTSRRDAAGNEYRTRLRVAPGGTAYLSSLLVNGTGGATTIGSETALATPLVANKNYRFKAATSGSSTVTLTGKVWSAGTSEPGWQASAQHASADRLSTAGTVGFWWYTSASGSDTSAAMDDYTVDLIDSSAPTPTPTPTPTTVGAQLPISYSLTSLSGTVLYVAPNGSDSAAGTASAPLATLASAVSRVASGQSATVVVRGGLYRQGNVQVPSGRSVRVVAYPGEVPVFSGAQALADGWVTESALAWHAYTAQPVTDGVLSFTTGQGLTGDGVGKYPDQAWVGSTQLRQVTTKAAVTGGTFWVDAANSRIYLAGSDVAKGSVEASDRDVFLSIAGADTTVEGLRITRFSSSANDYGAIRIYGGADRSVLRNVEIIDPTFQAIQYSGLLHGALLDRVTITGSNWMAVGSSVIDDLTLSRVKITNSNTFGEFTHAPQSGALKASRNRRVKVLDSLIANNNSHGLWFDQSNVDVELAGNTITGNAGNGVSFEISDDLLMVNNYVRSSGSARAVKLAGSSGLKLVNNTIVGGADPLGVYVDSRSKPGCADPSKPLCPGGSSTDRDNYRPIPATLDWMPRIDLMLNNIIATPTASGYCGVVTAMCITAANATATAPIQTVIHPADAARGIPQTRIDGNVYSNGTDRVVTTGGTSYLTHTAFGAAMALTPVSIPGIELRGKSGSGWVSPEGTPTSALTAANSEAVPVPTDARINQYIPAGTKAYGYQGQ